MNATAKKESSVTTIRKATAKIVCAIGGPPILLSSGSESLGTSGPALSSEKRFIAAPPFVLAVTPPREQWTAFLVECGVTPVTSPNQVFTSCFISNLPSPSGSHIN